MSALLTPIRPTPGEPYDPAAPEPEFRFEVIDGHIVRRPMGFRETRLACNLFELLAPVIRASGVGECYADAGFYIPPRNRGRKPDVSVLTFDRWPKGRPFPDGDFIPAVPALAVEVVSPNDTAKAVAAKRREYLRGGVRLVWLIDPDAAEVQVYDSTGAVRVLTRDDTLTADPVVPGFALPLADLFPPPAEEQP